MYILLLIFVALYICFNILKEKEETTKGTTNPIETNQIEATEKEKETDYSKSYQKKYLLTKNEWHEYKKLKQLANNKNLQVFPKVRLLDLIEPRRGEAHYKSLLYKIQSKHVDFIICDQNAYIKAIVEIDDNSHNTEDRKNRDEFVDSVLTSVGYKVIRTKAVTEDTLKEI